MCLGPALGLRLVLPVAVLALAACSSESVVNKYVPNIITPYRMDIQQGNFVTQDMVDKLQKGQTRDQVRFILGTPLLTDAFHASRWDYIFRFSKGWNDPEKHSLTVFFGPDDKLAEWAGDVPPPKSQEPVAEDKGFFGWFGKSSTPKPVVALAPLSLPRAMPPRSRHLPPRL
jgi:outer membrane protein assembly factor BamE